GKIEEREGADHDVALERAADEDLERPVAELRHRAVAPIEVLAGADLHHRRELAMAHPEGVEALVERRQGTELAARRERDARGGELGGAIGERAERAREHAPAEIALEDRRAAHRLHARGKPPHGEPAEPTDAP